MKPHRGIAILTVLFCASCQVQQYIDNEDLRIYNTPIGKTKLTRPAAAAAPETQASIPANTPAAPATPAPASPAQPLPPSIQSGSDWTEETPGAI
ncbi:hypothetical protein ICN84_05045 [Akkermansia glycaniphila]|uniref:hypothetical protein n=1 Tax=Akkermansia glycaniphila TaxID=1679444 RepID=UPI001C02A0E4|nr:hypothetical protein [Akkermansia glycaniphila]MBT9449440.1 hypothetical protein [Akkermansia glycaniphila]